MLSHYRISVFPWNGWYSRKNGQQLMRKEKQVVLDIFNFIKARNPDTSVSWLAADFATVTDVNREVPGGSLTTPKKKRPSSSSRSNRRQEKHKDSFRCAIRWIIYKFYFKNQTPTMSSLLTAVNSYYDLPEFNVTILYVLLKESGYKGTIFYPTVMSRDPG